MIPSALGMWRRWRAPVSVGVLDQGVGSGANLVLSILLARWMAPAEYGAFAIGFALLLLLAGPYATLLTDPLSVVGPRHFAGRYLSYLRALCMVHAALTIPLAVALGAIAFVPRLIVDVTPGWALALCLATPFVLLLWLLRGACYLEGRPGAALAGSALYGLSLIALVASSHVAGLLTAQSALAIMGLSGAIA